MLCFLIVYFQVYTRSEQTFSAKDQRVNIFRLAGRRVSIATISVLNSVTVAQKQHRWYTNEHGHGFIYKDRWLSGFGPWAIVCKPLGLTTVIKMTRIRQHLLVCQAWACQWSSWKPDCVSQAWTPVLLVCDWCNMFSSEHTHPSCNSALRTNYWTIPSHLIHSLLATMPKSKEYLFCVARSFLELIITFYFVFHCSFYLLIQKGCSRLSFLLGGLHCWHEERLPQ